MLSQSFKQSIYVSVLVFLFFGFSIAQDKNDNQESLNMNGNMKMGHMHNGNMHMGHTRMKQDSTKEFNLKTIDENKDGKVYQCPMDFDVLSDQTGKCPNCGMKLKEVSLDKAAENLISKGFTVKPDADMNSIVREGVINLKAIDANKDGKVFQDMMDYNVISDTPGKCPLCGMTLQEVSLEQAKTNLIKKGFNVK